MTSVRFDPKTVSGLAPHDADARLLAEGYNELPTSQPRSVAAILVEGMGEPMFLLLVSCGVLYLLLGDIQEALVLLGFVGVVLGITMHQEWKTERTLDALRDLSSPRALVIRGGQQQRIAGREVVREDMVILAEGDRVPADAVLLWCTNFATDESLLTGESVPVRKRPWDGTEPLAKPGGDDLPSVYAGTLVVSGQGMARVYATGRHTELGKIGQTLATVATEKTPLQGETDRLVRRMAVLGLLLCILVVLVYGLTRGPWLQGILAGLALAMAMIPEEFPVVWTVFLAFGAWRIAQHRVLTRRTPALEALGAATVLCVDKTGTLTQNRMSVRLLWSHDTFYEVPGASGQALPEDFHELVEFAILASQRDPFDPMERALRHLGGRELAATEHLHDDWTLIREYPLSPGLLALSHVWQTADGTQLVIAAKGAPEAIADLCHLDPAATQALAERVQTMARAGLRVLGVARADRPRPPLPAEQHDFTFMFLGLVGFADPVRPGVSAALAECYQAGIRVLMITGDYPSTAQSIAQQIGLHAPEQVITGADLDAMDEATLRRCLPDVSIFARVAPEQKLRLVNALKANGAVVAMTGDGVNDAPALRAAHIGIAMGGRGTDVAREAAALVLLDDDFASMVQAVRLGRRIFTNLHKAMAYIVAIHIPIAGLSLLPVLLQWPLLLLPMHIAFLELLIDPACSIVFEVEPAEADVMRRPPRPAHAALFDRRTLILCLLQGGGVLLITLLVFLLAHAGTRDDMHARALTFTTLLVANLGLIFTNRSWSQTILAIWRTPNAALWWVTGGAAVCLGLVLYIPALRAMFGFGFLRAADLGFCLLMGLLSVAWFELFKYRYAR